MEELVTPADQDEVMKSVSSDLGGRFTRWEVVAGTVEEIRKAETEAPKLLKALSPARREQYSRLAVALDAGNTIATLTISPPSPSKRLVMPNTDADGAARGIRQRMEGQRDAMVKHFAERSLQTYSYVYRNATDAQMEKVRPASPRVPPRGAITRPASRPIDQTISQSALALRPGTWARRCSSAATSP